ncbi:hypothetical protein IW262DRAFT_1291363 [Armillaria fumosa]|nr:hypothetical protein IW262DRAFT_1291363 [Armillaria fumosa]
MCSLQSTSQSVSAALVSAPFHVAWGREREVDEVDIGGAPRVDEDPTTEVPLINQLGEEHIDLGGLQGESKATPPPTAPPIMPAMAVVFGDEEDEEEADEEDLFVPEEPLLLGDEDELLPWDTWRNRVWVPEVRIGDVKNMVLAMSLPEALLVVEKVVVSPPSTLKSAEMLPTIESLWAPNTANTDTPDDPITGIVHQDVFPLNRYLITDSDNRIAHVDIIHLRKSDGMGYKATYASAPSMETEKFCLVEAPGVLPVKAIEMAVRSKMGAPLNVTEKDSHVEVLASAFFPQEE